MKKKWDEEWHSIKIIRKVEKILRRYWIAIDNPETRSRRTENEAYCHFEVNGNPYYIGVFIDAKDSRNKDATIKWGHPCNGNTFIRVSLKDPDCFEKLDEWVSSLRAVKFINDFEENKDESNN